MHRPQHGEAVVINRHQSNANSISIGVPCRHRFAAGLADVAEVDFLAAAAPAGLVPLEEPAAAAGLAEAATLPALILLAPDEDDAPVALLAAVVFFSLGETAAPPLAAAEAADSTALSIIAFWSASFIRLSDWTFSLLPGPLILTAASIASSRLLRIPSASPACGVGGGPEEDGV